MSQARLPLQDKALVDALVRATLAILVVGQAAAGYSDSDIWGHMAIGLDMLDGRQFLWTDPYSFTHDQRWINHEWLWDLLTASIYRSGGLPALIVLRSALVAAVLWSVDRSTRRAPPLVRLAALAVVALACAGQWRSTRPQIATLALYAVTMTSLGAWWLPALFAFWANVHGGWVFGVGAIGLHAIVTRERRHAITAGLCVLATLANPYGVHLWAALVDAMTRGWADLTEWQPVWTLAAGYDALPLWLLVAGSTAALWTRVSSGAWAWAWSLTALAAAANSRRLTALAAVTSAVALLPGWTPASQRVAIAWTPRRRSVAAGLVAASVAVALSWIWPTFSCFPPLPAWRAPEADAVAFLRSVEVRRVVPHFDYGEYAIFHLRDRVRVAIDNRRETVYSERAVLENQRFADARDFGYPDRIGADAVWWPVSDRAVIEGLERRGWVRRFEGPRTVVLLRTPGSLVRGKLLPGTPCFPNP